VREGIGAQWPKPGTERDGAFALKQNVVASKEIIETGVCLKKRYAVGIVKGRYAIARGHRGTVAHV